MDIKSIIKRRDIINDPIERLLRDLSIFHRPNKLKIIINRIKKREVLIFPFLFCYLLDPPLLLVADPELLELDPPLLLLPLE